MIGVIQAQSNVRSPLILLQMTMMNFRTGGRYFPHAFAVLMLGIVSNGKPVYALARHKAVAHPIDYSAFLSGSELYRTIMSYQ